MEQLFERLLTAHGAALGARARRWLPTDQASQEDLMQQTLLRLWESQPAALVGNQWEVRAYLLTTMDNLARDRVRRAQARPREVYDETPVEVAAGAHHDVAQRAVARVHLASCIGELSAAERQVVDLVIVQDLGGVQAASALQMKTPTMWSRLRRALSRLRTCLDSDRFDHVGGDTKWQAATT